MVDLVGYSRLLFEEDLRDTSPGEEGNPDDGLRIRREEEEEDRLVRPKRFRYRPRPSVVLWDKVVESSNDYETKAVH